MPSVDIFDACEWPDDLHDEAMANARLIAAAPALLAALQVDEAMARYQWSHTTQEEFLATLTALGWPGPDVGLIGPWIEANRRAAIDAALPEPPRGEGGET